MRVLLLHPDDVPWRGEWSDQRWDVIVDLGSASPFTYEDWSRRSGVRVFSIYNFTEQTESFRWVGRIIDQGRGVLLDRLGLDWWEIVASSFNEDFQALYLARRLSQEIALQNDCEIFASRPHHLTACLSCTGFSRINYFQPSKGSKVQRGIRIIRSARHLRPRQMLEIALDKWDPCYGLRRRIFEHKRARLTKPCFLLPSAYSNVTRSVLAYARQVPRREFLLAITRQSGVPQECPDNVKVVHIAAYARANEYVEQETAELLGGWNRFCESVLKQIDELKKPVNHGLLNHFPMHFQNGLRLRDAWNHLLESEPIQGVLCGDDLNYYSRLPVMLARQSGRRALYCSHGALDGGFLFKLPSADTHLVKGAMESDYLQRTCGMSAERIRIAPPERRPVIKADSSSGALVFFSQPYEAVSGRTDEIYREVLPRLWSAASRSGRKLVVKLHPFESLRGREELTSSILSRQVAKQVEFVGGGPPDQLLSRTWCGVTVDSSIAVECAIAGIPFFLCGWLDFSGMGYLEQFARFKVATVLDSPAEIERIPELVAKEVFDPKTSERLYGDTSPEMIEDIFSETSKVMSPKLCAS
jgi:hypothetical protein